MEELNRLRNTLRSHLPWHGARLAFVSLFLMALFQAKTVNLADYARRWGLETLFGVLKTRGFCLESTHFADLERLSRLVALLSIAFVWAMKAGLWIHHQQPIPLKTHGRRAKSLFRTGLDFLRRTLSNLPLFQADFYEALQLLSCT